MVISIEKCNAIGCMSDVEHFILCESYPRKLLIGCCGPHLDIYENITDYKIISGDEARSLEALES